LLAILLIVTIGAGCPFATTTSPHDKKAALDRLAICKEFLVKHQLEGADTECTKAIKYDPDLDEAWVVRGLISFTHAVEAHSSLEIDGCLTGVDAEATHVDLDKALQKADDDFAHAATHAPDYGEAWSNRGSVHSLQEDYGVAVEYFTKALDYPARLISPGLTRANLGWALFHQNKLVEAAKELRQALQFQPNMCVATYRLARVYFARQEWEKAAELFDKASTDATCASQEASYFLMKTRLQQGLADDARIARDACLKISPRSCVSSQCRADGAALGNAPARP
jgi:Tfp pilus assembly protein PilF